MIQGYNTAAQSTVWLLLLSITCSITYSYTANVSSDVKIVCALNSEEGKQRVHSRLALLLSSHDPLSNVHDTITYKNTNTSKKLSVWIKSTETWTTALWSVLFSYCTESPIFENSSNDIWQHINRFGIALVVHSKDHVCIWGALGFWPHISNYLVISWPSVSG